MLPSFSTMKCAAQVLVVLLPQHQPRPGLLDRGLSRRSDGCRVDLGVRVGGRRKGFAPIRFRADCFGTVCLGSVAGQGALCSGDGASVSYTAARSATAHRATSAGAQCTRHDHCDYHSYHGRQAKDKHSRSPSPGNPLPRNSPSCSLPTGVSLPVSPSPGSLLPRAAHARIRIPMFTHMPCHQPTYLKLLSGSRDLITLMLSRSVSVSISGMSSNSSGE